MKVKEFFEEVTLDAPVVREEDSLWTVVTKMSEDPKTRSVYVTDKDDNLVGVIPIKKVLEFLGQEYQEGGGFVRDALASEARDIMNSPLSVTPDTEMEEALEIVIKNALEELPVCENGRIIGDLICFEIIKAFEER